MTSPTHFLPVLALRHLPGLVSAHSEGNSLDNRKDFLKVNNSFPGRHGGVTPLS